MAVKANLFFCSSSDKTYFETIYRQLCFLILEDSKISLSADIDLYLYCDWQMCILWQSLLKHMWISFIIQWELQIKKK